MRVVWAETDNYDEEDVAVSNYGVVGVALMAEKTERGQGTSKRRATPNSSLLLRNRHDVYLFPAWQFVQELSLNRMQPVLNRRAEPGAELRLETALAVVLMTRAR